MAGESDEYLNESDHLLNGAPVTVPYVGNNGYYGYGQQGYDQRNPYLHCWQTGTNTYIDDFGRIIGQDQIIQCREVREWPGRPQSIVPHAPNTDNNGLPCLPRTTNGRCR